MINNILNENVYFSILSLYGIYLKLILFIILLSTMIYRYIKYKNNFKINHQKNLNFIFSFVLLYLFIDMLESQAIYRKMMLLSQDHDLINEKLHTDYDIKFRQLDTKVNLEIGKIYDDYNIQPKIEPIKDDNKRKSK